MNPKLFFILLDINKIGIKMRKSNYLYFIAKAREDPKLLLFIIFFMGFLNHPFKEILIKNND